MNIDILLLEPFYGGSHKQWADGLEKHSRHDVTLLTLPAYHWKWRMNGAAITLAQRIKDVQVKPALIITTGMLDLALFKSLLPESWSNIPIALYMHENQFSYPIQKGYESERDVQYGFTNYTSALVADWVFYNSKYHKRNFLSEIKNLLNKLPDFNNKETIEVIKSKSSVLHLALDLKSLERPEVVPMIKGKLESSLPIILWNHRWEHDKNPDLFFNLMFKLKEEGYDFELIVLGEKSKNHPIVFDEAKEKLKDKIIHWGFCKERSDYVACLHKSNILLVTSNQDFFGGSIVEAMYCGVFPLLPNRLVYPEHILNSTDVNRFVYEQNKVFPKLKQVMEHYNETTRQSISQNVSRYDWSKQIEFYDTEFLRLVNKFHR